MVNYPKQKPHFRTTYNLSYCAFMVFHVYREKCIHEKGVEVRVNIRTLL